MGDGRVVVGALGRLSLRVIKTFGRIKSQVKWIMGTLFGTRIRRALTCLVVLGVVAAVVPPLALWYYDGPRTSRTSDGYYATFLRHEGEQSIQLSRFPADADPTGSELQAAAKLLAETTEHSKSFADYGWASTEGGYRISNTGILGRPNAPFHHLFNPDYMADGKTLDPSRPESLMFYRTDLGMTLVGIMYMMPPGQHGPQPGGRLTQWHYHPVVEFCMDSLGVPRVKAKRGVRGGCPVGLSNGPMPEMMHVWLVDNPYGAFGHRMALPVASDHMDRPTDMPMNMPVHEHGHPHPYREFVHRAQLWLRSQF